MTRATLAVVLWERVAGLMVLVPSLTTLLEEPDSVWTAADDEEAAANVSVDMLEVTVEPSELVVVMATVVGMDVDDGGCEDCCALEEPVLLDGAELCWLVC